MHRNYWSKACLLLLFPLFLQAQAEVALGLYTYGLAGSGDNAFWSRANTYGRISDDSFGLGLISGGAGYYSGENWRFLAGASGFYSLRESGGQDIVLSQAFGAVQWKQLELAVGSRQRPQKYLGLSSTGGDILWSNNALPPPGIVIQTTEPLHLFWGISLEGAIGNYWLGEDRYVKDAMLHYKEARMNIRVSPEGMLHLGLKHYAQWGGDHPTFGPQPSALADLATVFIGREGRAGSLRTDAWNALGNHLGSYLLGYTHTTENFVLNAYHQSLFEDSSGQEGKTFPDGVWGLFLENKGSSFFKGALVEYVQTTWQSGRSGPLANDNYFNNGIYRSGWTYRGNTIGLPFLQPREDELGVDNLVQGFHFGQNAAWRNWDLKVMGSLLRNYGNLRNRLTQPEKLVYSGFQLGFNSTAYGSFHLGFYMDYSNMENNKISVGLGYRYNYTSSCKHRGCTHLREVLQ